MTTEGLFSIPLEVSAIEKCLFYHSIELPDHGKIEGHWDLCGRFDDYVAHVSLAGKRVLDVGTASGFLTWEAEKRGADVVSFDADSGARFQKLPFIDIPKAVDYQNWLKHANEFRNGVRNSYWLAHRMLRSHARLAEGDVYQIPPELGLFDVVLVGQILVHLSDGIAALRSIASRCADTLVIAEKMINSNEPTAHLVGRADNPDLDYAFWHYSHGYFREILGMLGFKIVRIASNSYTCNLLTPSGPVEITTIVAKRREPYNIQTVGSIVSNLGLTPKEFYICFPAALPKEDGSKPSPEQLAETISRLETGYHLRALVAGHLSETEGVHAIVDRAKQQGANPVAWLGRDGDIAVLASLFTEAKFCLGNDSEASPYVAKAIVDSRLIEQDRGKQLAHSYRVQELLEGSEADRIAQLELIQKLESKLQESEADRAARLELIQKLDAKLQESEADRATRLEVIQRLDAKLKESEADRAARLEVIQKLDTALKDSEADRAARLEVIQKLDAKLKESEAERATRLEAIQKQETQLRQLEQKHQELMKIRNHFLVRGLTKLGLIGK